MQLQSQKFADYTQGNIKSKHISPLTHAKHTYIAAKTTTTQNRSPAAMTLLDQLQNISKARRRWHPHENFKSLGFVTQDVA